MRLNPVGARPITEVMSVHIPRLSTLPQLRGLLEVTRLVRDERDLPRLVDAIASTISDSLGFRTVAINLYRPTEGDFRVAAVHGNVEAREALLGTVRDGDAWAPYLAERFLRRGAYLIPRDEIDWEGVPSHVPELELSADPDAWHPEDALIVPMRGADGALLGVISVDEPESGQHPSDEELDVLVAFAEHVIGAIDGAQAAAAAARDRAALSQLLDVSASLVDLDSAGDVLQAVASGIGQALEFERVAVCLARDGMFSPTGTAGWEPGDPGLDFTLTAADLDLLLVPEFEIEGCYLIERAAALARVGGGSRYASQRGGAGPRAWSRHWLLIPLVERDGSRSGFIWVDDPADAMLPSSERLQALRTFANQATMALRAAVDFETVTRSHAELAALHSAAYALLEQRDVASVLSTIVDSARSLADTQHGYLYLVDEQLDRLRLAVGFGYFATVEPEPIARGEGLSGRVWENRSSLVVDDYSTWPSGLHDLFSPALRASIGVPLLVDGDVVGVLGLVYDTPSRAFTVAEVAVLERLSQLASLALDKARLHDAVQRELAERGVLNEQLRQAQKMESIGRLAGGIAHDFNNLLTAINGYAELMLMDFDADELPTRDSAEQIARAAKRAASLTGQLLAFSRKQVLRPQVIDLNEVVGAMASMLARMLGERVVLTTAFDIELGSTLADPTQIEQVVLNLALNGRDAMPEGGTLALSTASLELSEDDERPHPDLEPGSYVTLSVRDTGVGMPPELVAYVFEPFFTTKAVGEGTGLGLATVHGIVNQTGGAIWVESTPGEGTTFTVCLPLAP